MLGTVVVWDEPAGQGQIRAYGGTPKPFFSVFAINKNDFPITLTVGQLVVFDFEPATDQVKNIRSFHYQGQSS